MKYPEEMYIDSQIFAGDMDGSESNFEEKIVKTRKAHKCCVCEKEFPSGEKMLMQRAIIEDAGWCSCYICLPCVEQWLEESGQMVLEFIMCHVGGIELEAIVQGCVELGFKLGMFGEEKREEDC